MYNKRNRKKGFIAFVVLFLLVIFALMGIAYTYSSRMNTDILYVESQRIKARNYAQAGIEKVKISMCNICQKRGTQDMSIIQGKPYDKEFEDGGYRIVSVKPFYLKGKVFKDIPHEVKGRIIGKMNVWEVTVEGYTKNSKTVVELKTILRIYHDNIVY